MPPAAWTRPAVPPSPGSVPISRRAAIRTVLRAGATAGLLGTGVAGCAARFADTTLRVGTGGMGGVYYALGGALADGWQRELGLRQRPAVRGSAGSVENLALLAAGQADVVFSTADVIDDAGGAAPERAPRALARVYDDALQVVVPADSSITEVAGLRGRRVSVGAAESGVLVSAGRVLDVVGLAEQDFSTVRLGIDDSLAALRDNRIDAFFWSGGLPTGGVTALAANRPIRLLDLGPLLPALRRRYPVYDAGTVPAATYGIPRAVTTLLVRNFLLVTAGMPDDLAAALVAGMFAQRELLVRASSAGRAIDPRSAIGTQPIPLHPGAQRYYRDIKDG